ncbi:hypothetical protein PV387_29820 [Streptomyces sp. ME02-6987-2C]|uniref:hypothetical protein n=1 Tax=unclassified Streptomyces TaxID=2593676 RepID=UPI0029B1D72E|nr:MULTISPECIES: hypothetical protein [unclassified Streptomyces]MDX3370176.1 hypothetical protein [Streptomyces sp. ME02-6987-2C]MDX3427079.1 hypothetical protein [Streptomyces sp. ME02-6985-2c]
MIPHNPATQARNETVTHHGARVLRVGDGLVTGPAAGIAHGLDAITGDQNLVEVGGDLDTTIDGQRTHQVVADVPANVVVPGSPGDAFHQPGGAIGGKTSSREGSACNRSAGRTCRVWWVRRFTLVNQSAS